MPSHIHQLPGQNREKNIKIAIALNVFFTIVEIIGGLWTNSLAILSDALHDLGDSIALIVAWLAERNSTRPADAKRTYGYRRLSLFSALFAGVVLVSGSLFILSEAIPRLLHPESTNAAGMIGIAVIGVLVNVLGVWRLKRGQSQNEKVLTWHLMEDVLGWVVILIGAIIMHFWDVPIVDPIMTIGFTVFVLWGVVKNLRSTFNIFMQGVPEHIDIRKIQEVVLSVEGVVRVHDVHVWSLEGETDIFSGHIVVTEDVLRNSNNVKRVLKQLLREQHIEHSTIELESEEFCSGTECQL